MHVQRPLGSEHALATYIGIGTFTCKPYWNRNMHVQLTLDSGLLLATDLGVGAFTCNSHFIQNIYRLGLEHALATYIGVGTFPTYIGVGILTCNLHWSRNYVREGLETMTWNSCFHISCRLTLESEHLQLALESGHSRATPIGIETCMCNLHVCQFIKSYIMDSDRPVSEIHLPLRPAS